MNKVVLSIFIVLSSLFVSAQTGIKFQHKSFDEVCEMAVEQNKLVFIDFYHDTQFKIKYLLIFIWRRMIC